MLMSSHITLKSLPEEWSLKQRTDKLEVSKSEKQNAETEKLLLTS